MLEENLSLAELADFLHISPDQAKKLAEKGAPPGRRVGGEWRFARAEVTQWLAERIGASSESELADLEDVLAQPRRSEELEQLSVADLIPPQGIAAPLAAKTRSRAIEAMVDLAADTGLLWDPPQLAAAVEAREELMPTAMDSGAALLHPRRPLPSILGDDFLVLGVASRGVPFGGAHGALTDVFFLICACDDRTHLRMLARVGRLCGAEGFLSELRGAEDEPAVRTLIRTWEDQLAT